MSQEPRKLCLNNNPTWIKILKLKIPRWRFCFFSGIQNQGEKKRVTKFLYTNFSKKSEKNIGREARRGVFGRIEQKNNFFSRVGNFFFGGMGKFFSSNKIASAEGTKRVFLVKKSVLLVRGNYVGNENIARRKSSLFRHWPRKMPAQETPKNSPAGKNNLVSTKNPSKSPNYLKSPKSVEIV